FEERRGKLYAFRFSDPFDHASCMTGQSPQATDQAIGTGDGVATDFSLVKTYGSAYAPYERPISKPVDGSVIVALDGEETVDFTVDITSGLVSFTQAPDDGVTITAGFLFDVPVRFDTDSLEFSLSAFKAGDVPSIPLVEVKL
ncbi:DUF2460 domain-containing protein, partial [uncultured Cohaesibacter sp.]|uniref:DUF2460 domain-containing protein n=1 Tax=uncultured Cohaesibacter sp. TaxID=1002546 RepID=UPI00292CBD37